jgi:hypothetical protein
MPDMQESVWFRGEAGVHPALVSIRLQVFVDYHLDEIRRLFHGILAHITQILYSGVKSRR